MECEARRSRAKSARAAAEAPILCGIREILWNLLLKLWLSNPKALKHLLGHGAVRSIPLEDVV